ncbi:DNA-binding transcriptional regulator [Pontiellaceae bacterium B12227]|nr:DNA-binding transcriptional regulator [Pontiellaceae bacterium B12227]
MKSQPHVLMMIEASRESGRRLIAGVADYARHFGPWHFHWQPLGLSRIAESREEMTFDGILVRDTAEVQSFMEAGVPTVAFTYGKQLMTGVGWVNTDDRGISQVVANHFVQRGFRHFAFCGFGGLPWSMGRGKGFSEALNTVGFSVNEYWIPSSQVGEMDDTDIIRWLSSLPRPVALMATNDELGWKLVHLCQEAGLKVPDDCAVVGVDNDPVVCGMSDPPLSSVGLDQYQSGYQAAALLDKMMKGKTPESLIITAGTGDVVVRQSSDIFAIEDAAVAKALRFIQENAHRPVKVDEVASASGMYRRGLERRFKEHSSRTILQACREARVEYLEKILKESKLSLEEIADQCGFTQTSHLTRFYISIRGESPSSYRKRVL